MYDKEGNVVDTRNADGKPVSMDDLRGKVDRGVITNWNAETQQWESMNLLRDEALSHQEKLNIAQAK
jgi:hypothetical protein